MLVDHRQGVVQRDLFFWAVRLGRQQKQWPKRLLVWACTVFSCTKKKIPGISAHLTLSKCNWSFFPQQCLCVQTLHELMYDFSLRFYGDGGVKIARPCGCEGTFGSLSLLEYVSAGQNGGCLRVWHGGCSSAGGQSDCELKNKPEEHSGVQWSG